MSAGEVATQAVVVRPAAERSAVASRRRRRKRVGRLGWNVVGLLVFVVMVFPVFWMISTAFKPDDDINRLTPTWLPVHATLSHFRDAIHRPFFWDASRTA